MLNKISSYVGSHTGDYPILVVKGGDLFVFSDLPVVAVARPALVVRRNDVIVLEDLVVHVAVDAGGRPDPVAQHLHVVLRFLNLK